MSTKTCKKCQQTKPIDEFCKNKTMRDGHDSACKECRRKKDKEYRNSPVGKLKRKEWSIENAGKYKDKTYDYGDRYKGRYKGRYKDRYKDRYKGRYKETMAKAVKRWLSRDPNPNKARQAVAYAVVKGLLPKITSQRCSHCNQPAHNYHHHKGYTQEHWLDVIPLCHKCHKQAHAKNRT